MELPANNCLCLYRASAIFITVRDYCGEVCTALIVAAFAVSL